MLWWYLFQKIKQYIRYIIKFLYLTSTPQRTLAIVRLSQPTNLITVSQKNLTGLEDKTSITLLRYLLDTIEQYGKPKIIRGDNERCFTSQLMGLGLWLLCSQIS